MSNIDKKNDNKDDDLFPVDEEVFEYYSRDEKPRKPKGKKLKKFHISNSR